MLAVAAKPRRLFIGGKIEHARVGHPKNMYFRSESGFQALADEM
jgi:hypothetical protein